MSVHRISETFPLIGQLTKAKWNKPSIDESSFGTKDGLHDTRYIPRLLLFYLRQTLKWPDLLKWWSRALFVWQFGDRIAKGNITDPNSSLSYLLLLLPSLGIQPLKIDVVFTSNLHKKNAIVVIGLFSLSAIVSEQNGAPSGSQMSAVYPKFNNRCFALVTTLDG